MKVSKAAPSGSITTGPIPKKNTVQSYQPIIDRFCQEFGDREVDQVTSDDILRFLNRFTEGNKPYTDFEQCA
jgi:hypothetical protein